MFILAILGGAGLAFAGSPEAGPALPRVSFVNPDICRADQVLVATVIQRDSYVNRVGIVFTDAVLRTDVPIVGEPASTVMVTVAGGVLPTGRIEVVGEPEMALGSTYALALQAARGGGDRAFILGYHGIPQKFMRELPNRSLLAAMWTSFCAAHPDGVGAYSQIAMSEVLSFAAGFGVTFPPPDGPIVVPHEEVVRRVGTSSTAPE